MGTRSVNPMDFVNGAWEVPIEPLMYKPESGFMLHEIIGWLEPRTTGKFLVLVSHVVFDNERDATIFRIGSKYAR